MNKINIIIGLNAAGKSKDYDNLDKKKNVKKSSKDIHNNSLDFNYKQKEINEMEKEISNIIDTQIEKSIIAEMAEVVNEGNFIKRFKNKYKDKISVETLLASFNRIKNKDNEPKGYLSIVGLLNLNTEFQDILKKIDKTKINSVIINASIKYAIAKKINAWNSKWKRAYEMAGGKLHEEYEVKASGVKELDVFFDQFSQKDLQKAISFDFQDVQAWAENWDEWIIESIWFQIKNHKLIDLFEKIESLYIKKKKNDRKYFNHFRDMIISTNIGNLNFNEEDLKIEQLSPLSSGQIGILLSAQMAAEAEAEDKSLALDDITEVFDNGVKSMVLDFFINKTKISNDISLYTHHPIDITVFDEEIRNEYEINYYWISETDNKKYEGSPILYNTLSKIRNPHKNIDYIILITARIMNRQIANFSKYYHSNKKVVAQNHGDVLWDFISQFSKNIKIKNPDKYFGEAKKWINSKMPYEFKFKDLAYLIIKELEKENLSEKRHGISLKFLDDFWKSMYEKDIKIEKASKYLHFLDFMTSIKSMK